VCAWITGSGIAWFSTSNSPTSRTRAERVRNGGFATVVSATGSFGVWVLAGLRPYKLLANLPVSTS
jgi:hypothetical protein